METAHLANGTQYYVLISSVDPNSPVALNTLKLIKDWYKARALEGLPTKNINSMSVMYSVACLLELNQERGQSIFDEDERKMYSGWIDEWAEWVVNDLPREFLPFSDSGRSEDGGQSD